MFVVFSASKFQLPYYVNILFPFLAVLCADWILTNVSRSGLWLYFLWASSITFALAIFAVVSGMEFTFNGHLIAVPLALSAILATVVGIIFRFEKQMSLRSVYCGAAAIGIFALYSNLVFYPRLLQYQSGSQAAFYANANLPDIPIGYTQYDNLLRFYAKADLVRLGSAADAVQLSKERNYAFLVDDAFTKELDDSKIVYRSIRQFDDYRITRLTSQFLNPATRPQAVIRKYLILIE